jgi:hypothetical protein
MEKEKPMKVKKVQEKINEINSNNLLAIVNNYLLYSTCGFTYIIYSPIKSLINIEKLY